MSDVIIYHNPKCSKSRQTLELLRKNGVEPTVVEYLKHPPSVDELTEIISKLGMAPTEVIRTTEPEYSELGLFSASYDQEGLIEIMAKHPKLIERPIVVKGDKAVIGRPPENVLAILK